MQIIKNSILLLCFVIFFYKALLFLYAEVKHDYGVFKKFYGLSDDQKRALLIGDLYKMIKKSSLIIPETANVLLLTDDANEGLFFSYHLFPRKFFINNAVSIRKLPPSIDELDPDWLRMKNIKWVIFKFSKKSNQNKIIKIVNKKILKQINL